MRKDNASQKMEGDKMPKFILNIIVIVIILSGCATQYGPKVGGNNDPINLIPMYGHPEIEKTEAQRKADENFINTVVGESGSRKKSSRQFSALAWSEMKKNNLNNAMRRFNQAWLLDPDNYESYWGFGLIALEKRKPTEAATYFEKSLRLVGSDKNKPRVQVEAARAYAWQGSKAKKTDPKKSEALYKKANSLIDEALDFDSKYGSAYSLGGFISYEQGNYKRAWEIVEKAHASGGMNLIQNL